MSKKEQNRGIPEFETTQNFGMDSDETNLEEIDFFGIAFDCKTDASNGTECDALEIKKIGRYLIERSLGIGGFGEVFLAHDESLQRKVALKVINRGAFGNADEKLLEEGRTLAQLNHPGIVKVHTVGKTDGRLYFVSEYIKGQTLGQLMVEKKLSLEESAILIGRVAMGLDYAHQHEVVHRDIKPNNIIVTSENHPILIDFGIALAPKIQTGEKGRGVFGTPSYMSPEQARGEGHLVDGRSDIYSLGVILYGLLTQKTPFDGDSEDLIDKVASQELPVPHPRTINPQIPRALERICLKALAKRARDRYRTAADFAKDLNDFAKPHANSTPTLNTSVNSIIVPKGLRSFNEGDADFFLQLLPGIRDREGVPDSIRFWQAGIENEDAPFRVGVLYGPSGSGKSSFLKAGLIPLLQTKVEVITIAADVSKTERALQAKLRERFSELPKALTLDQCFRHIREHNLLPDGHKLLIIIDQFEQWLHANGHDSDLELVSALRQCDGKSLQVILTLRDDFWMGIGKLMEDIDVPLLQTKNFAPLDLFEKDHARKVLIEFGIAYGCVSREALSKDESKFIDAAIFELSQVGKIVPVQLSLFAEFAKKVKWSGDSLKKLGGAKAVGVQFLDAAFTDRNANPAHRAIEQEARAILEALLPTEGDIRIHPLNSKVLQEKAEIKQDNDRFLATMEILDRELRLVTPVEASRKKEKQKSSTIELQFQLTHDYLIPSLRDWIFQGKRSTMKGRAMLRMGELASLYRNRPDRRHLPSFFEWLRFMALTNRSHWSRTQRKIMSVATKHILIWGVIIGGGAVGVKVVTDDLKQEAATKQLFLEYVKAPVPAAENILDELEIQSPELQERAKEMIEAVVPSSPEWLNLAAFLLSEDPTISQTFLENGLNGNFEEFKFVIHRLQSHENLEMPDLWSRLVSTKTPPASKLRLAAALATLDPDHENWNDWGDETARMLMAQNTVDVEPWIVFFLPVKNHLESPLMIALGDWIENSPAEVSAPNAIEVKGNVTAGLILSKFNQSQPEQLIQLLDKVNPEQLPFVLKQIARLPDFPHDLIRSRIAPFSEIRLEGSAPPCARVQAKAILALALVDEGKELWRSLMWAPEVATELRSWLIHLAPNAGIGEKFLTDRLLTETDPSVLSAILLTLGSYDSHSITFSRPQIEETILQLFTKHPDSLVHASSRWLLVKSGWPPSKLAMLLNSSPPPPKSKWRHLSNGHTLIEIQSPASDQAPGKFLISMTETTVAQYQAFKPRYKPIELMTTSPDCPVHYLSPENAMAYCNWLSQMEGIDESQHCYKIIKSGNKIRWEAKENIYERTGYRLPSLEEFLYAGSGTMEGSTIGPSEAPWLRDYAWFLDNSDGICHPVGLLKPTGFGLFDAVGNFQECCDNRDGQGYFFAGSNYRTARWALDIGLKVLSRSESTSTSVTFRIAKTLPSH